MELTLIVKVSKLLRFSVALFLYLLVPLIILGVPAFNDSEWAKLSIPPITFVAYGIFLSIQHDRLGWMFRSPIWKQVRTGILTLAIALPIVYVISEGLSAFLQWYFNAPPIDQLAVSLLKKMQGKPWLLAYTIIDILLIVPFVEEILFRGFMQTTIKQFFNPTLSIFLTSVIFAFCHYSSSQGLHNIAIIASLFVLSCFLGWLRESQNGLWGSVTLHMGFNSISVLLLFLTE